MGHHLGKHLLSVKGGGFFDLFTKGIVEAGQKGESIAKQTGMPNASPPPPPSNVMTTTTPPTEEPKSGGALFHRKRDMLGEKEEAHEEHTARRFGRTRKEEGGYLSGQYEGMGECGGRTKRGKMMRKQKQMEEGNLLHTLEDDFPEREGREATHGDRTSGKKRTMVFNRERGVFGTNTPSSSGYSEESSSGSGRASRAAIVKKVMAEKGCSMIEASKYVKAHGLYKGGASCGGTRSKTKPSNKEKNPYGRTHTSELSLGMTKKVKKPAPAPAPAPEMGLALDLPLPEKKGKGRRRRAPAGPSDGRRKRAEIVKKVMAEKGCSMIEASKYVKAHGLY
jgi:hypothetical protein